MISIIDTLETLGDFFAVLSKDVGVNGVSLDAVLHASELELAKKASKEYVDEQIVAIPKVTKTSQLQNDSGFLTQHQDISGKADADTVEELSVRLSNTETEQSILSERMNTFTKLTEGSTTGDAELEDARVGADGITYENVGDAIRNQILDVKSDLSQYHDISYKFGQHFSHSGTYFIPCNIKKGETYFFTNKGPSSLSIVSLATEHKSDSAFQEIGRGMSAGTTYGFVANADAKFVYISWVAGEATLEFVKQKTKISEIDENIANNTALINELGTDVAIYHSIAYKISRKLSKAGAYWIEADVVKGKAYGIANRGSGDASVISFCTEKDVSTAFQTVANGLPSGARYGVTAENNAKYIYVSYINAPTEIEFELLTPDYTLSRSFNVGVNNSFIETLEEATKYKNSVIYVTGTHDIYQEYLDKYGTDYFENYEYDWAFRGPILKNNVTIYFSGNSLLTFHYPGNNEDVLYWFSPLNADASGFTLYNLQLECSRCRYGIHDERGGMGDEYHNHYFGGYIKIDNSNNPSQPIARCIGGGLGRNGEVTIQNMRFISVQNDAAENRISVDYHNDSKSETAQSHIVFANNYIDGKYTFAVRYHGNTTQMTQVICSGNCVGREPFLYQSDASFTTVNMELIKWNNTIRN